MKQFKIRASKGGSLLTNSAGKSYRQQYNEAVESLAKHKERLITFKNQECKSAIDIKENKIPETEKRISDLLPIIDKVEMGETAKSYIKEWVISQFTGKTKKVTSKYFERGHDLEADAGVRVGKHYGVELVKNEQFLENEYFTGTFDFKIENERIIDTKVPFDCFTFPYFVFDIDPDYYTQLQIYMELTGIKKASLCYCLENGSNAQIDRLSWKIAKEKGKDEPDMEEWDEAEKELNYDHLPDHLRIKFFEFEYDSELIERLKNRVKEAREYIENELVNKIKF